MSPACGALSQIGQPAYKFVKPCFMWVVKAAEQNEGFRHAKPSSITSKRVAVACRGSRSALFTAKTSRTSLPDVP